MSEKETFFIDDRCIIPDFIKAMTPEQINDAIKEIEACPEKADSVLDKLEADYNERRFA